MRLLIILLPGLAVIAAVSEKCPTTYKKHGCFGEKSANNRLMKELIITRRDEFDERFDGEIINWNDYKEFIHSLYCECAALAEKKGYPYFGLQYYGECWSGPLDITIDSLRKSKGNSDYCYGSDFNLCDKNGGVECVGKAGSNYVYLLDIDKDKKSGKSVIDGGYTQWTKWSVCSKSCGGGFRIRERSCTKPEPKNGGKDCISIGPDEEIGNCNNQACLPACKKAIDLGIIMDASRKIKRKNFLAMKQFVQLLSDDLEISKDGSHLGIIHYSKYPHVDFTPHDAYYYDRKRCRAKIESLVYTKGGKRIDRALKAAEKEFFCENCSRKGVPQVLLVITTGATGRNSANLRKASMKMKEKGVTILAIGVGKHLNQQQLKKIASKPADKHVFAFANFAEVQSRLKTILSTACLGGNIRRHK